MKLLARKPAADVSFGPPYAVLNLSKVGIRYFRFMIKATPASRERLVQHFVTHPNVGWIFSANGWFNLAVGVWAKDNAEINAINSSVREVLGKGDEIVYESELTSLYSFGNRMAQQERKPMAVLDSAFESRSLSPLELDLIKLLTLDSSLPDAELSQILNVSVGELVALRGKLEAEGVIAGYQERINYGGFYYKVFVDTLSARTNDSLANLTDSLWNDPNCIYIERANGKYDLEFEVVLQRKSDIKSYVSGFSEYKTAILRENLHTNLYPLNKIANLKEIRDTLAAQEGNVIDFQNSKLWYLNYNGTEAYLSIYDNKKYFELMNKSELDLFNKVAAYIREHQPADSYSLIDIGSGDGLKGRIFIERFGEEKVKAYYPVDIQPIELATALKANEGGAYSKQPVMLDIENLPVRFPLKQNPNEGQIYLFFGGTYGNFPHAQINGYLKPLLTNPASVVLVSMPIRKTSKTDEEIISSYANLEYQGIAFGPLEQLGFELDDFEVRERYPHLHIQQAIEANRHIGSFILAADKALDGKIYKKGTVFKMITSWKPTLEQFKEALDPDFSIQQVFSNDDMAIIAIGTKQA